MPVATRGKRDAAMQMEVASYLDGIRQQAARTMAQKGGQLGQAMVQQGPQPIPGDMSPPAPTAAALAGTANTAINRMSQHPSNFNEYKQAGLLQQRALNAGAESGAQPGLPPKMGFEFAPGAAGVQTLPAWNPTRASLKNAKTTIRTSDPEALARAVATGNTNVRPLSAKEQALEQRIAASKKLIADRGMATAAINKGLTTAGIELGRNADPAQFEQMFAMYNPEAHAHIMAARENAKAQMAAANGQMNAINQNPALGGPEVVQANKEKEAMNALANGQLPGEHWDHYTKLFTPHIAPSLDHATAKGRKDQTINNILHQYKKLNPQDVARWYDAHMGLGGKIGWFGGLGEMLRGR